jgi:hypothetical protein
MIRCEMGRASTECEREIGWEERAPTEDCIGTAEILAGL